MAEVFEYELRGKDTSFGNTVKNAVKVVGELKSAGAQVLSSFTGGLIGGGIAQSVLSTVNLIRDVIREARQLMVNAERLSVSRQQALGFANLETALDLPKDTFGNVAGAVENAVQEALQGNAEMGRQFGALGLDARQLEGLSKVEQMFRVLGAFRLAGSGPEQRFAARAIMGSGAEALEPYALGGSRQLDFQKTIEELSRLNQNSLLRGLYGTTSYDPYTRMAYDRFKQLRDVEGRQSLRADLGGFSEFGLNRGRQLAKISEGLAGQAKDVERASLTPEKQLNEVIKERAELFERIRQARDPEMLNKLIGRELSLAMQQAQLEQQSGGPATSVLGFKGISRDMDQMARAGFFRGGAPDIATDTMRKQLAEMQRIAALLKTLPAGIAREI